MQKLLTSLLLILSWASASIRFNFTSLDRKNQEDCQLVAGLKNALDPLYEWHDDKSVNDQKARLKSEVVAINTALTKVSEGRNFFNGPSGDQTYKLCYDDFIKNSSIEKKRELKLAFYDPLKLECENFLKGAKEHQVDSPAKSEGPSSYSGYGWQFSTKGLSQELSQNWKSDIGELKNALNSLYLDTDTYSSYKNVPTYITKILAITQKLKIKFDDGGVASDFRLFMIACRSNLQIPEWIPAAKDSYLNSLRSFLNMINNDKPDSWKSSANFKDEQKTSNPPSIMLSGANDEKDNSGNLGDSDQTLKQEILPVNPEPAIYTFKLREDVTVDRRQSNFKMIISCIEEFEGVVNKCCDRLAVGFSSDEFSKIHCSLTKISTAYMLSIQDPGLFNGQKEEIDRLISNLISQKRVLGCSYEDSRFQTSSAKVVLDTLCNALVQLNEGYLAQLKKWCESFIQSDVDHSVVDKTSVSNDFSPEKVASEDKDSVYTFEAIKGVERGFLIRYFKDIISAIEELEEIIQKLSIDNIVSDGQSISLNLTGLSFWIKLSIENPKDFNTSETEIKNLVEDLRRIRDGFGISFNSAVFSSDASAQEGFAKLCSALVQFNEGYLAQLKKWCKSFIQSDPVVEKGSGFNSLSTPVLQSSQNKADESLQRLKNLFSPQGKPDQGNRATHKINDDPSSKKPTINTRPSDKVESENDLKPTVSDVFGAKKQVDQGNRATHKINDDPSSKKPTINTRPSDKVESENDLKPTVNPSSSSKRNKTGSSTDQTKEPDQQASSKNTLEQKRIFWRRLIVLGLALFAFSFGAYKYLYPRWVGNSFV